MQNSKSRCQKTKNSSLKRYIILNLTFILITDVFVRSAQRWNLRVFYPIYFLQCSGFKSDNLQYNMLVRWFTGTYDSSTKRHVLCKNRFNLFFYKFTKMKIKSFECHKSKEIMKKKYLERQTLGRRFIRPIGQSNQRIIF